MIILKKMAVAVAYFVFAVVEKMAALQRMTWLAVLLPRHPDADVGDVGDVVVPFLPRCEHSTSFDADMGAIIETNC